MLISSTYPVHADVEKATFIAFRCRRQSSPSERMTLEPNIGSNRSLYPVHAENLWELCPHNSSCTALYEHTKTHSLPTNFVLKTSPYFIILALTNSTGLRPKSRVDFTRSNSPGGRSAFSTSLELTSDALDDVSSARFRMSTPDSLSDSVCRRKRNGQH
eukprot:GFYU01062841.1.p1 GENE.GFYU01062841.1~~GFYU01062841.1.p1  ORF type:complete len:159 (+),score=13.93 GFYU01062841.1:1-477(+)